jgi:hypothetical protein
MRNAERGVLERRTMGEADFGLSKYYLSCVTSAGDVVIAYGAHVRLGGVSFPYASVLWSPAEGAAVSETSLAPFRSPRVEGEVLRWDHGELGFSGRWDVGKMGVRNRLYEAPEGAVDWYCMTDRGRVTIEHGAKKIRGLGYGEQLVMTVKPWQLPIRTLRWGSFVSESEGVVWIQWEGPRPLEMVLHNKREVEGPLVIEDGRVAGSGLELVLGERRTLREGSVLTTAFEKAPLLAKLFPRSILRTHESKWVSAGRLTTGGRSSAGFAIHERVAFPERGA